MNHWLKRREERLADGWMVEIRQYSSLEWYISGTYRDSAGTILYAWYLHNDGTWEKTTWKNGLSGYYKTRQDAEAMLAKNTIQPPRS